jgi:uncharacterized protein YxjI
MRYQLREQVFSFHDRFAIRNERDEEVAYIDGKLLSLGDRLVFSDVLGNELVRIEQRLMSWGATYQIFRGDVAIATVRKKVWSLRPKFHIELEAGGELVVEGEFMEHEYVFVREDRTIASVSKRWYTLAETFGVELVDGEDAILILAVTVIIGLVHRHKDHFAWLTDS